MCVALCQDPIYHVEPCLTGNNCLVRWFPAVSSGQHTGRDHLQTLGSQVTAIQHSGVAQSTNRFLLLVWYRLYLCPNIGLEYAVRYGCQLDWTLVHGHGGIVFHGCPIGMVHIC